MLTFRGRFFFSAQSLSVTDTRNGAAAGRPMNHRGPNGCQTDTREGRPWNHDSSYYVLLKEMWNDNKMPLWTRDRLASMEQDCRHITPVYCSSQCSVTQVWLRCHSILRFKTRPDMFLSKAGDSLNETTSTSMFILVSYGYTWKLFRYQYHLQVRIDLIFCTCSNGIITLKRSMTVIYCGHCLWFIFVSY